MVPFYAYYSESAFTLSSFTILLVIAVFTVYTNDERQGGVDRGNESYEFQNG